MNYDTCSFKGQYRGKTVEAYERHSTTWKTRSVNSNYRKIPGVRLFSKYPPNDFAKIVQVYFGKIDRDEAMHYLNTAESLRRLNVLLDQIATSEDDAQHKIMLGIVRVESAYTGEFENRNHTVLFEYEVGVCFATSNHPDAAMMELIN